MSTATQTATPAPARRLPGGLSPSGALSLLAILGVVVVVSLPRLRGIALQENEADARATAQLLAHELRLFADDARADVPELGELLRRSSLAPALSDVELVSGGSLLRRHGYVFEIVRMPAALQLCNAPLLAPSAAPVADLGIRAWPWRCAATGVTTFLVSETGVAYAHPNEPPLWEGPHRPPPLADSLAGWAALP